MDSVDAWFRHQHGIITRDQAVSAGMSPHAVDYRVRMGRWLPVHRGVYRLAAVESSWVSRTTAAVLASGGVASHRSAAALWRLDLYQAPLPEVTIERGRRWNAPDVRVHESTQWAKRGEVMRRGMPCTGIERTVLDMGAVVSHWTVERLAESAIRQRLTTWRRLMAEMIRSSRRGRDGCGALRAVLDRRLRDQTVPLSDFSRVVANLIADHGLPAPVIEHRILDDAGALILQADLAWPSLGKAIELDGLAFHGYEQVARIDRWKRNRAKAHGWQIMEVLWRMFTEEPRRLLADIERFLQ